MLNVYFGNMEVAVYMSYDAYKNSKPVFKRSVVCPDAFEYQSFCRSMKAIFGEKTIIEFIVV